MKLTPEQLERIAKSTWRLGENIGYCTETVKLEDVEIKRKFIRLENEDGELMVLRVRDN